MPSIVDATILYALADEADDDHRAAREAIATERQALVVPQVLLCEVCYLIHERKGPETEAAFVESLGASDWGLEPLTDDDLPRVVDLMRRYADAGLGFVDASIVTVAERLGVRRLYTFDRRHFALVRPRHVDAFELLP